MYKGAISAPFLFVDYVYAVYPPYLRHGVDRGDILLRMTKRKLYYKGIRTNIFGIPDFGAKKHKSKKEKSISSKLIYNSSFTSPFKKDTPKTLIVMYDIPHAKKKERDWFRRHLIKFNYHMIQKSVWVGPAPLP